VTADWSKNRSKRSNLFEKETLKEYLQAKPTRSGLDYWNQTKDYLEPVLDKNNTYSTVFFHSQSNFEMKRRY
jgi:hypothetical protein